MSDPRDIETLADAEHESWGSWTRYMLPLIEKQLMESAWDDEELKYLYEKLNGLDCVKRWIRQHNTPYADLSEKEKESDRKVVREKLAAYRPEDLIERMAVAVLGELDISHASAPTEAALRDRIRNVLGGGK